MAIQIKRGTTAKINASTETLKPGQLLLDMTTGQLSTTSGSSTTLKNAEWKYPAMDPELTGNTPCFLTYYDNSLNRFGQIGRIQVNDESTNTGLQSLTNNGGWEIGNQEGYTWLSLDASDNKSAQLKLANTTAKKSLILTEEGEMTFNPGGSTAYTLQLPSKSGTLALTDQDNSFTGKQTFNGEVSLSVGAYLTSTEGDIIIKGNPDDYDGLYVDFNDFTTNDHAAQLMLYDGDSIFNIYNKSVGELYLGLYRSTSGVHALYGVDDIKYKASSSASEITLKLPTVGGTLVSTGASNTFSASQTFASGLTVKSPFVVNTAGPTQIYSTVSVGSDNRLYLPAISGNLALEVDCYQNTTALSLPGSWSKDTNSGQTWKGTTTFKGLTAFASKTSNMLTDKKFSLKLSSNNDSELITYTWNGKTRYLSFWDSYSQNYMNDIILDHVAIDSSYDTTTYWGVVPMFWDSYDEDARTATTALIMVIVNNNTSTSSTATHPTTFYITPMLMPQI